MISQQVPLEKSSERKRAKETLRLALAMRGGVSLAVWIGGAVSEIDALRLANPGASEADGYGGHPGPYNDLLQLAGYGGVEVDILSGASAGGLNGAIYAASLMYGFSFDEMLRLWVLLGDVEALARPTTGQGQARPSLFEGEGYFRAQFRQQLNELVTEHRRRLEELAAQNRPGYRPCERLDLFLTATRSAPVPQVYRDDVDHLIGETRSAAFFHFHHLGEVGGPFSDFTEPPEPVLEQLALAGRATSSFPIAFEPATIKALPGGPGATGAEPNLFGLFSEGGITDVIDGGVLDNIPVGRAIRAIAAAPASAPAARWLLYLNPNSAVAAPDDSDGAAAMTKEKKKALIAILGSLRTTINLRFNSESLSDDLEQLHAHNRTVSDRRAARATLLVGAAAAAAGDARRSTACDAWGQQDAARVAAILADPGLALIQHPFVTFTPPAPLEKLWKAGPEGANRAAQDRTTFRQALPGAARSAYDIAGPGALPLIALGDTVDMLLTVAQQLPQAQAADGDGLEPEAILYRVRLTAEVLHSVWEQRWIIAAVERGQEEVGRWVTDTSLGARRSSERITPELVHLLTAASESAFHAELKRVHELAGTAPDQDPRLVGLDELWAVVSRQALAILGDDPQERGRSGDPIIEQLRTLLAEASEDPGWLAAAALATAPLHRRQLVGEAPISFLSISADAPTSLGSWFGFGDSVGPGDKLAGNQLLNFGAFFSARWRGNDWLWGRLDSASGLVDLLTDSRRWFDELDRSADTVLRSIEAVVTTPSANLPPEWGDHLAQTWREASEAVSGELTAAREDPTRSHPLPLTRQVLRYRIQAEIVARVLPLISTLGDRPSKLPHGEPLAPADAASDARLFSGVVDRPRHGRRAGRRLPADLDSRRYATIVMRTGLNAWPALLPNAWWRYLVSLFKPVALFAWGSVLLPRRTLAAGIVGFGAVAVGRWGSDDRERSLFHPVYTRAADTSQYWTGQRLASIAVVVGLGGLLGWRGLFLPIRDRLLRAAADGARPFRTREVVMAAIGVAVALAVLVASLLRVALFPFVVGVVAPVVALIGFQQWMKRWSLAVAMAGTLANYLAWAAVAPRFDRLSNGWWVCWAFISAISLTTAYVTFVDVLPNRRPAPTDSSRPTARHYARTP